MKKRLWLLCGIPGSSKSTWIRDHRTFFAEKSAVISRDEIRFSIVAENEEYFSKENEVWDKFVANAKSSISENVDTILDATHISESSRGKILRALKDNLQDVEINAIVINTGVDTAIEQNDLREGTRAFVPKGVIRRMNSSLTLPTLEEGFDHIYIYEKVNGKIKYQIIEKESVNKI